MFSGHGGYELAKENADKPKDEEKKKKLWLRIAKHMLKTKVTRVRSKIIYIYTPGKFWESTAMTMHGFCARRCPYKYTLSFFLRAI